jgi:S-adenosylmethionine decarboxylase proenzyme
MKILGRHLIAELSDCRNDILNDLPRLEKILKEAARRSGAVVVNTVFHRYNPQGISGIVVIAESHLSLHTWPEYGYAAVDCFTCGDTVDPYKAVEHLKEQLFCQSIKIREINRGIPSDTDSILAHKSTPKQAAGAGM